MIWVLKGISGSGKSTRAFLLLYYFRDALKYEITPVFYEKKQIGHLVKEANIIFLGKIYENNGIESYQGLDAITGIFRNPPENRLMENFSRFLMANSQHDFLVEGAGTTGSNRLRPLFLADNGFNEIYVQYYNFHQDQKREYLDRIVYRSGKEPKIGSMWFKNIGFKNDFLIGRIECDMIKDRCKSTVCYDYYNAPSWDFGVKYFTYKNDQKNADGFKYFVKKLDYVNKNKFGNRARQ